MKTFLFSIILAFIAIKGYSQVELDLSNKSGNKQSIDLDTEYLKLTNCVRSKYYYIVDIEKKIVPIAPIDVSGFQASEFNIDSCNDTVEALIIKMKNEDSEEQQKINVSNAKQLLASNIEKNSDCISQLNSLIQSTIVPIVIPFKVANNQIITVTVTKFAKDSKKKIDVWTFTLNTEEKSRWLVHYGLTFAPSVISKVDHFHLTDTSIANSYTVKRNNSNGPKPWDNLSATINYTYAFGLKPEGLNWGFTAGFGINGGFGLSGHAGLSAIIGENIIIGTGLAMIQRSILNGKYKEGQIIKENLEFDSLHEKVWLPEMFFTIGYRFDKNPNKATKAEKTDSTKE